MTGESGASFGELVRLYRVQRQMTQREVAEVVGCTTAYIGLIEQGKRGSQPTPNMTRSLAQAMS